MMTRSWSFPREQAWNLAIRQRLEFQIHVRDTHHPITAGMPKVWLHPSEQLTHGQHGPAEGLTILTYAHSPVSNKNEPMDWVRSYGKGRVYTTMLGHTWIGEPTPNLDCVGFHTLLAQGRPVGCHRSSYDSHPRQFPWAGRSFTPQADLRAASLP